MNARPNPAALHTPVPNPAALNPAALHTPVLNPAGQHPASLPAASLRQAVPCHDAQRLTAGGMLAHIDLNGQIYSLRITRAGKLILTK